MIDWHVELSSNPNKVASILVPALVRELVQAQQVVLLVVNRVVVIEQGWVKQREVLVPPCCLRNIGRSFKQSIVEFLVVYLCRISSNAGKNLSACNKLSALLAN